jgi:hypothetical protein
MAREVCENYGIPPTSVLKMDVAQYQILQLAKLEKHDFTPTNLVLTLNY